MLVVHIRTYVCSRQLCMHVDFTLSGGGVAKHATADITDDECCIDYESY